MKSIIELILDRESQEVITTYCERNERMIPNIKPKGSFYSTVYYSENYPLFQNLQLLQNLNEILPIELRNQTYFLDVFESCLVLRYENEKVRKINEMLKENIGRQMERVWPNLNQQEMEILKQFSLTDEAQKYPYFNPHITFSKNFGEGKLKKLPPFEEFLILDSANFKFKE